MKFNVIKETGFTIINGSDFVLPNENMCIHVCEYTKEQLIRSSINIQETTEEISIYELRFV